MWSVIIAIWFAIDIIRYIYYCHQYTELNKPVNKFIGKYKRIDIFLRDIKLYPEMFMVNLTDMFYGKVKPEDMKYINVCDAIYYLINENDYYIDDIKYIVKGLQLYYRKKYNRNIFTGTNNNKFIKFGYTTIKSWFFILPFYIITKLFGLLIQYYAKLLGYKSYIYPNRLRIWYSEYNQAKGYPVIYIHSSVGGISLVYTILKHFISNYNVIIPEIPGISFVEMSKPPPINEVSYTINRFIKDIYMKNISDDIRFNLIGHSLGNSICVSYINRYPNLIDKYFCIEGMLFSQRILKYFIDIEKPLTTIPWDELFTVPLFYRNLYVQYSLTRLLSLNECFIYDYNDDIKHIEIIMFHVKKDNRILVAPQIKYARTKNIPILYHIFNSDLIHGSFILHKKTRTYIIQQIDNKLGK